MVSHQGQEHLLDGALRRFGEALGKKAMTRVLMDKPYFDYTNDHYRAIDLLRRDFWIFCFGSKIRMESTPGDFELFRVPGTKDKTENVFLEKCELVLCSMTKAAISVLNVPVDFVVERRQSGYAFEFVASQNN